MPTNNIDSAHHHNRHNSGTACLHCQGIIDHEPWCVTRAPKVSYAYEIVAESSKLTLGDALILHSLGVTWADVRP